MDVTLVVNTVEHLENGAVRWYRRYSDGFGIGGVYWPDDVCHEHSGRAHPATMENVSAVRIERMCCEATSEAERAYLEGRWDEVHGAKP